MGDEKISAEDLIRFLKEDTMTHGDETDSPRKGEYTGETKEKPKRFHIPFKAGLGPGDPGYISMGEAMGYDQKNGEWVKKKDTS